MANSCQNPTCHPYCEGCKSHPHQEVNSTLLFLLIVIICLALIAVLIAAAVVTD